MARYLAKYTLNLYTSHEGENGAHRVSSDYEFVAANDDEARKMAHRSIAKTEAHKLGIVLERILRITEVPIELSQPSRTNSEESARVDHGIYP